VSSSSERGGRGGIRFRGGEWREGNEGIEDQATLGRSGPRDYRSGQRAWNQSRDLEKDSPKAGKNPRLRGGIGGLGS